MSELIPEAAPEQAGIKHLDEEELFANILQAGEAWSHEERAMVRKAYDLGAAVHKDDTHRDKAYTYHLLRNAYRIVEYLHITDPEILAGMILHDAVEDHPEALVSYSMFGTESMPDVMPFPKEESVGQQLALRHIEVMFTPRVAAMVYGLTNPPAVPGVYKTYEERLQEYVDHVAAAIQAPDVFIGKLSDWCDNAVGIVHSDFSGDPSRETHFRTKYGKVTPVLEARFLQPDIQQLLDPVARENVRHMFDLARQRLDVPE